MYNNIMLVSRFANTYRSDGLVQNTRYVSGISLNAPYIATIKYLLRCLVIVYQIISLCDVFYHDFVS